MFDDMSQEEQLEYLKLDRIIQKGEESLLEWVNCLMIMRDKKLYRKNYKTFEEYCQKKLSKSRQYINGLIKGVAAVKALPKHLESQLSNLKAAATLGSVPEKDQSKVVEEIVKEGKPVTAKSIKEKAAEVAKPKVEKPAVLVLEKDEIEYDIPVGIITVWNRREEVRELQRAISKVKCHVENALANDDSLFAELDALFTSEIKSIYLKIGTAMPYCVCPQCNGRDFKNCILCKGRGFISKYKWDNSIDDKTKNFRLSAIKAKK